MRQFILALALAGLATTGAQAKPVSALYVFGDSNVDIGRLDAELSGDPNDGAVVPPNTVAGRSSDGALIVEYIVERTGVGQENYAWGGATTGTDNIVGALVPSAPDTLPTGTLSQLAEFEAMLGAGPADPKGLYLLWAGSNNLFFIDKSSQTGNEAAVQEAVGDLTETVTRLDAAGAKHIVIATRATRPVLSNSSTPWTLPDLDPVTPGVQNPELNDASGNFLNAAIRGLVPTLDAIVDSKVALFDADAVIRDIIADSGANGFLPYDDSPSAYCIMNADCSNLINWDGAHKTSAVHAVMADVFIDQFGIVAIPLPAGAWLYLAALGASSVVALRGRLA